MTGFGPCVLLSYELPERVIDHTPSYGANDKTAWGIPAL